MNESLPLSHRSGPMSWTAASLPSDAGQVILNEPCQRELRDAAQRLADHPLPTEALRAEEFELTAVRDCMRHTREMLDHGVGFAIIDRIPVELFPRPISTQLYWLLMDTLGRPVAQKWDGTLVYDVHDTGRKPAPGNGVRSSKSNQGQGFHTDNAFNTPPEHVALFCLQTAKEGGASGLISFDSVYNRLLETQPQTVPRLFEPFLLDRQREHAPDDEPTTAKPLFRNSAGELHVNLSTGLVRQGHRMTGREIDESTGAALEALDRVTEADDLAKAFDFAPGQIQVVNNRRLGHRRTAFTDWPEPERRRHLVRIWLRDEGHRSYHGG